MEKGRARIRKSIVALVVILSVCGCSATVKNNVPVAEDTAAEASVVVTEVATVDAEETTMASPTEATEEDKPDAPVFEDPVQAQNTVASLVEALVSFAADRASKGDEYQFTDEEKAAAAALTIQNLRDVHITDDEMEREGRFTDADFEDALNAIYGVGHPAYSLPSKPSESRGLVDVWSDGDRNLRWDYWGETDSDYEVVEKRAEISADGECIYREDVFWGYWGYDHSIPTARITYVFRRDDASAYGCNLVDFRVEALGTEEVTADVQGIEEEAFYGIFCAAALSESGVQACCQALRKAGYAPEIIVTSEWSNLNPKTYYAVTAGRYPSKGAAEEELKNVQGIYADAYVKYSGDRR